MKMSQDATEFYVLAEPKASQSKYETDFLIAEGARTGDAPYCPQCLKPVGSLAWLPPYRALIELHGEDFGDVAFGPGNNLLVSERFRLGFTQARLRGISEFDPVEIVEVKPKNRAAPAYTHITVRYGCARVDLSLSGIVRKEGPVCPSCNTGGIINGISGVFLESGTWTEEDIFLAWGLPGLILVSERFRRFCIENNISNAILTPAARYSENFGLDR